MPSLLVLWSAALGRAVRKAFGFDPAQATLLPAVHGALAFGLSLAIGAITTLLVLRSDFSTTFTRGTARLVGTALGATLATVLVSLVGSTSSVYMALAILMAYLAYSVLLLNYALFSAFITIETVLQLTLADAVPQATAFDRVFATLSRGGLALLLYLLWPTWEQPRAFDALVIYVDQLRRYLAAVLASYVDPQSCALRAIEQRRRSARLARANAGASIERMRSEPLHGHAEFAEDCASPHRRLPAGHSP